MVKSLKCMFIVQPKPLITAHPFVCQHRFRDENCSDLNNSKFLICITSCWHNTSDVGQTNNSRLMRAWERSLPIKNLSTWSNCSLSAISKVSTCKQFHFFQTDISSFNDFFHLRTELLLICTSKPKGKMTTIFLGISKRSPVNPWPWQTGLLGYNKN